MNHTAKASTDTRKKPSLSLHGGWCTETLLQVDFWLGVPALRAVPGVRTPRELPSSVVDMVSDLIKAASGDLRSSSSLGVSASFKNPHQAVNAVRYLQRLIRGFSKSSESGPIFACYKLVSVEELKGLSPDNWLGRMDPRDEQFVPGQTLLVGDICNAAKSIPGLAFRDFPQGVSGPGETATRLSALELVPPLHMPGYVDEPVETTLAYARSSPKPVAPAAPHEHSPGSALTPTSADRLQSDGQSDWIRRRPLAQEDEAISSFARLKAWVSRPDLRWPILGAGGTVAAAAVLSFILILRPFSKVRTQPTQHDAHHVMANGPSHGLTPPTVVHGDARDQTKFAKPTPLSPSKLERERNLHLTQPTTAISETQKPNEPKVQTEEDAARVPSKYGMFSSSDFIRMDNEADKLAGDGNYDQAIDRYNTVLKYDPKNVRAINGLRRALYNKSHP